MGQSGSVFVDHFAFVEEKANSSVVCPARPEKFLAAHMFVSNDEIISIIALPCCKLAKGIDLRFNAFLFRKRPQRWRY